MARVKRVRINAEGFLYLLTTAKMAKVDIEGVPEGSRFRGWVIEPSTNHLSVFIEHESFPEIEPACEVPELQITMRLLEDFT